MTASNDPMDRLFKNRLGRMSARTFKSYCEKQGWSEVQVCRHTWMDEQGLQWSALGRLGYLRFTSSSKRNNDSLFERLLQLTDPGPHLARDKTDLIWAWMGATMTKPSASLSRLFERALSLLPTLAPGIPASGFGIQGDGGWLDEALGLVEGLVLSGNPPPLAMEWLLNEMNANVLGRVSPDHYRAWRDGWCVMKKAALGSVPQDSMAHHPIPKGMEEGFDQSFARRLDLLTKVVRNTPEGAGRYATTDFGFSSAKGDTLGLIPLVGDHSRRALVGLLEAMCDSPESSPPWGMLVPVMNTLSGLREHGGVSPALVEKVRGEMDKRAFALPGEPEGSLLKWSRGRILPSMEAWLHSERLDRSLPEPITPGLIKESRFRL